MAQDAVRPFESIESAQEYIVLLSEVVADSERDIRGQLTNQPGGDARQIEGLRLAIYKLETLERHLKSTSRILNDLRMLRRLLHRQETTRAAKRDSLAQPIHPEAIPTES